MGPLPALDTGFHVPRRRCTLLDADAAIVPLPALGAGYTYLGAVAAGATGR